MDNYKSSAQNEYNKLNELHNDISEVLFSIDVKNFLIAIILLFISRKTRKRIKNIKNK